LDLLFDSKQRLTVFDRLSVLYVNLRDLAGCLSLNLVHQLHSFNDANHCVRLNLTTDFYERISVRRRRSIKRADNRRRNNVQILIFGSGSLRFRARMGGAGVDPLAPAVVVVLRVVDCVETVASFGLVPRSPPRRGETHSIAFAFEFKFGEVVFPDQLDQFAQLIHVHREFIRWRAPSPAATPGSLFNHTLCLNLGFISGGLCFLIAHLFTSSTIHNASPIKVLAPKVSDLRAMPMIDWGALGRPMSKDGPTVYVTSVLFVRRTAHLHVGRVLRVCFTLAYRLFLLPVVAFRFFAEATASRSFGLSTNSMIANSALSPTR